MRMRRSLLRDPLQDQSADWRRLVRDGDRRAQARLAGVEALLAGGVQLRERLARADRLAGPATEQEPRRGIDGVLLPRPAGAQLDGGEPDLLRIESGEDA